MSFTHPPRLKSFSFLLPLLTVFLELPSPATCAIGRCEERCNIDRPYWSTRPYTLHCSDEYLGSGSEITTCRDHCDSCPSEICDTSNSDTYKCPSKFGPSPPISSDCRRRCDRTRPIGTTDPYTLTCKEEYETKEQLDECKSGCGKCLRSICSPYDPEIFHCPSGKEREPLTGACKEHCDNNRKLGTTAAYTINCKDFEFDDEKSDCKNNCWGCPEEVCDSSNSNIFYCPKIPKPLPPPPPPTYEGKCKNQCDDKRPQGPYGPLSAPYTFRCDEKYKGWDNLERRLCQRDCKKFCPCSNCDSKKDANKFNCEHFQLKRRCDDICNANRKYGTTEAYTLKCSTAYSTEWGIQYCKDTCVDCEASICDFKVDNDTYHCPVYIVPVVERPDPYPGPDRVGGGQGSALAVGFFIFLLIVVACIGLCIYCCVKKQSPVQTGQYYGAGGVVGGYPQGVQQPFPVNNYAQGQGYPQGGQVVQQQQPYPMNQYAPSQPQPSGPSVPVARSVPTSQLGSGAMYT